MIAAPGDRIEIKIGSDWEAGHYVHTKHGEILFWPDGQEPALLRRSVVWRFADEVGMRRAVMG